jgi:hypothetical protein
VMGLPVLQMGFGPIVTCLNSLWNGGGEGIFLSPCPFWIRVYQQNFFKNLQTF